MADVRVLVVEDEEVAALAHQTYVNRTTGFTTVAVARSFQQAAEVLRGTEVDLILLDMHLPDGHGMELLRRLRAAGHLADVMAVTSARESDVVRQAVAHGVVAYVLKPFTASVLQDKLNQYAAYRRSLEPLEGELDQRSLDALLGGSRPAPSASDLPKGVGAESLAAVREAMANVAEALSADQVGVLIGASRATARRCLEYLVQIGELDRVAVYGDAGRPRITYRPKPR